MRHISTYILFISLVLFSHNSIAQSNASQSISIDEKIGQMIMVGFHGFQLSDTSHVIRDITEYHTGGVILFDYHMPERSPNRNIDSPVQVTQLISELQGLSDKTLFVAVDQEGGRVARLKTDRGFPNHVSAQYLGEINHMDTTRYYAAKMAEELQMLGFNVNFAPVVDLNTNPQNPVIGRLERSFSYDSAIVTDHASIFLEEFNKNRILGVLKHFPGHGSAWNDSHLGMADVTDTWDQVELEPYKLLSQKDAPFAIMTAHVFNEHLDSDDPATLSRAVQHNLLREEIGFNGVLFSDDMQMEAIRSFYGLDTAVEKALLAGVDVLVFANNSVYDREIVPKLVQIIQGLISDGIITEERIHESYERIQRAKARFNINGN